MNGKDIFISLQYVGDDLVQEAAYGQVPTRKATHQRKPAYKKTFLVAALIAMMLMLVGCAVVYALKLQDLKMGVLAPPTPVVQPWETAPTHEDRAVISLQGYIGSPNYNASKEWFDFQNSYDPDGTLLDEADKSKFRAPERYASYFCYTQEMMDKVDEICEKYQLTPLGREWIEGTVQGTFDALGITGIFKQNVPAEINTYPGYYYQDGTFHMEGTMVSNHTAYLYSLRCVMNGSFDGVYTVVGDIADYDEWEYATAQGFHISLALNQDLALMILNKEVCFVTVTLQTEDGTVMERGDVEALAELFDFSFQPQKIDVEAAEARHQQGLKEAEKQAEANATGFPVHSSYQEKVSSWLANGNENNMYYTLRDLNGDGDPEMMIGNGESFGTVYTMVDDTVKMLFSNGTDSGLYLCEGNVLDYQNGKSHSYYAFDGYYYVKGQYLEPIERLDYFEDVDQYRKDLDGDLVFETAMTDEEVQSILDKYPLIDSNMKPIGEFPMD